MVDVDEEEVPEVEGDVLLRQDCKCRAITVKEASMKSRNERTQDARQLAVIY